MSDLSDFKAASKKAFDDMMLARRDLWERVIGEAAAQGLGLPVEWLHDYDRDGLRFQCGIVYWLENKFDPDTNTFTMNAVPSFEVKP